MGRSFGMTGSSLYHADLLRIAASAISRVFSLFRLGKSGLLECPAYSRAERKEAVVRALRRLFLLRRRIASSKVVSAPSAIICSPSMSPTPEGDQRQLMLRSRAASDSHCGCCLHVFVRRVQTGQG